MNQSQFEKSLHKQIAARVRSFIPKLPKPERDEHDHISYHGIANNADLDLDIAPVTDRDTEDHVTELAEDVSRYMFIASKQPGRLQAWMEGKQQQVEAYCRVRGVEPTSVKLTLGSFRSDIYRTQTPSDDELLEMNFRATVIWQGYDDAFNLVHYITKITSLYDWSIANALRNVLNDQTRRNKLKKKYGGLLVEPVLARIIETKLTAKARRDLMVYLTGNPTARGNDGFYLPQWTRKHLTDLDLEVPQEIETIFIKDGLVRGKIRIDRYISWNMGKLWVYGQDLSEVILQTLTDAPLSRVIEHPMLDPNAKVTSIVKHKNGNLVIKTDTMNLPLPDHWLAKPRTRSDA